MSMSDSLTLSRLSKWAGERWDWVQAGGGNSSIKTDGGALLVKASGISLTEVEQNHGFATLNLKGVQSLVRNMAQKKNDSKIERERLSKELLGNCLDGINNDSGAPRPSIESFLHAFLFKYTLHIHPIASVSVLSSSEAKDVARLCAMDLEEKYLYLNYQTPGIDLALELYHSLEKFLEQNDGFPKLVFMENHGILISSNSLREVRELTEKCTLFFEKKAGLDFGEHRILHRISALVNQSVSVPQVLLLGEDVVYKKFFEKKLDPKLIFPICPDDFVFWGAGVCLLEELLGKHLEDFRGNHKDWPKVLLHKHKFFFIGKNRRKAREMEEVFRARITILVNGSIPQHHAISKDEMNYLGNWEAEKFRQKV